MSDGPGPGSAGNVIAAICSLIIPGLGQLVQGRIVMAAVYFILGATVWILTCGHFGWIVNLIATIDAALYRRK
jgi:TM2 domain-containing membrane protein YozV